MVSSSWVCFVSPLSLLITPLKVFISVAIGATSHSRSWGIARILGVNRQSGRVFLRGTKLSVKLCLVRESQPHKALNSWVLEQAWQMEAIRQQMSVRFIV